MIFFSLEVLRIVSFDGAHILHPIYRSVEHKIQNKGVT